RVPAERLDLDDVRAPVGEDGGTRRRRQPQTELDHADAGQRAIERRPFFLLFAHRRATVPPAPSPPRGHGVDRRAATFGGRRSSTGGAGLPEEFEGDLAGAVFWGADLRGSRFRDVNLSGARISHAWLTDVEVDALIDRVVINGVDVTSF